MTYGKYKKQIHNIDKENTEDLDTIKRELKPKPIKDLKRISIISEEMKKNETLILESFLTFFAIIIAIMIAALTTNNSDIIDANKTKASIINTIAEKSINELNSNINNENAIKEIKTEAISAIKENRVTSNLMTSLFILVTFSAIILVVMGILFCKDSKIQKLNRKIMLIQISIKEIEHEREAKKGHSLKEEINLLEQSISEMLNKIDMKKTDEKKISLERIVKLKNIVIRSKLNFKE